MPNAIFKSQSLTAVGALGRQGRRRTAPFLPPTLDRHDRLVGSQDCLVLLRRLEIVSVFATKPRVLRKLLRYFNTLSFCQVGCEFRDDLPLDCVGEHAVQNERFGFISERQLTQNCSHYFGGQRRCPKCRTNAGRRETKLTAIEKATAGKAAELRRFRGSTRIKHIKINKLGLFGALEKTRNRLCIRNKTEGPPQITSVFQYVVILPSWL